MGLGQLILRNLGDLTASLLFIIVSTQWLTGVVYLAIRCYRQKSWVRVVAFACLVLGVLLFLAVFHATTTHFHNAFTMSWAELPGWGKTLAVLSFLGVIGLGIDSVIYAFYTSKDSLRM